MYLIGLTGNIATGKSTVCQILQQLGARVVDADLVAHAVLQRGTPAWRALVEQFGYDILNYDGTVNRRALGSVVFRDPAKLRILERITHPAVGTELALLVRDATEPVVVIEAVKLYEAGLADYLDALWVVTTPPQEQKRRLMQERGLSGADAEVRLQAQPPLDEKLKRAAVVIDNGGSIEETRVQVIRAFVEIDPPSALDKTPLLMHWLRLTPSPAQMPPAVPGEAGKREAERETPPISVSSETVALPVPSSAAVLPDPPALPTTPRAGGDPWTVGRARPGDAPMLAGLLAQIEGKSQPLSRAEMLTLQGKFGYWLVRAGEQVMALAAWQAENLAAVVHELWAQDQAAERAVPMLLQAIEVEANALTCEVVVILVPERAAGLARIAAQTSGYEPTPVEALHKLWRSVIEPLVTDRETLYVKRLREIVTKPI
jgi:dephospho-CoA kinase